MTITIDEIHFFCSKKELTSEEFPFDNSTLVFKVLGKVFAVCPLNDWESGNPSITLKCDPDYAVELRNTHDSICPGFHSNKKHWNTIYLSDPRLSFKFIFELIDHSYSMVINNMPKKLKNRLKAHN